tara:strand:+ start:5989 stop:6942 length:954 start_codon:yes stop_codon:yes gene_type:complete
MLNLVVLDDYQDYLSAYDFSNLSATVQVRSLKVHYSLEDLEHLLADCDILVAMRERTTLPRTFLAKLPRLKLLITTGMRNEAIDPPSSLLFCGTRILSHPVVELTWALILSLSRKLVSENRSLISGNWQTSIGDSIQGKVLGVIGLGRSGEAIAKIGKAFGMNVISWSTNLDPERAKSVGVRAVSRSELFEQADVVTVHLRLSDRTHQLIGDQDFKRMKPTALFINTSRAQIVDTTALIRALEKGSIAGAGVDVFDSEPLGLDSELLSAPNTLLTPHIGYVVNENYQLFFDDIAENVNNYLVGTPVRVIEKDEKKKG